MKEIKVKITFEERCLGTANNNKEIHEEFIASKAPDAISREEEIAAIGVDEVIEKGTTVFPRNEDGGPIFWDYQIKGFLKEACASLQRCKKESFATATNKIKAYKKVIDKNIFIEPRAIDIDMKGGVITHLQRPLRGQTAQGERVSLANSEVVPEGSEIICYIVSLNDDLEAAIIEWLDFGYFSGIGQWRNASFGRFDYEILDTQEITPTEHKQRRKSGYYSAK